MKLELFDQDSNNNSEQEIKAKPEDIRLVQDALIGNDKAFAQLYQKYHLAIRTIFLISRSSIKEIDDLEQDAWALIWQKLAIFDPKKGSFYTFAHYYAVIILKRFLSKLKFLEILSLGEEVSPEQIFLLLEKTWEYLRITFQYGGPPHMKIAFGFNKLLGYGPQRIISELSQDQLRELSQKFITIFDEDSKLPKSRTQECFRYIFNEMDMKVIEVLKDKNSQNTYKDLLHYIVGSTFLQHYYNANPSANISDWSNKVIQRVRRELIKCS